MDRRKELVRRAYEETAAAFAAARRSPGAEAPWLERFMLALPVGAPVVDLGCGNGEPIGRTLARAGFAVTGIDFSREQVRRAIAHVPSGRFVVADMATVELESGGFGKASRCKALICKALRAVEFGERLEGDRNARA